MPPFSVGAEQRSAPTHNTNKNLPSTMGREEDSRGTTQISTRRLRLKAHFAPTNIGFPHNAGIAVQTTKRDTWNLTPDTPFT
jgi:hypothetical protein